MHSVEWQFDRLDVDAATQAALAALLTPEEVAQAARFHHDDHRRRFVVRRARLRQALGARLGCDPAQVPIVRDGAGKPHVAGWAGHFNSSHSREVMLLAFADRPIGCDVETIDPGFGWRALADRLFAGEERRALAALDDQDGCPAFFRCWARKEAFVKAIGQGLAWPLDAFAVTCGQRAQITRGGQGWAISALDQPGLAAAIVVQAAPA